MVDSFKHQGLRKKLVKTIEEKGIENPSVINAIAKIPRHFFMDNAFLQFAYEDKAFPIGAGQTISQPYTVAFQTELLDIKRGDKVLEIGTGSGYQTAVLIEVGAKVFSIERQKLLFTKTKRLLKEMGYSGAKLFYGDGYKGLPVFAPFDKILVTAGAPFIPEALKEQLRVGGSLVIPVDIGEDTQVMTRIIKKEDGTFETNQYGEFKFVPLLEDKSLNGD